jgi:hypothetical protein
VKQKLGGPSLHTGSVWKCANFVTGIRRFRSKVIKAVYRIDIVIVLPSIILKSFHQKSRLLTLTMSKGSQAGIYRFSR